MTSISCNETTWTTSFLFCNSPSGHCTNRVAGPFKIIKIQILCKFLIELPIASKSLDLANDLPNLVIFPD